MNVIVLVSDTFRYRRHRRCAAGCDCSQQSWRQRGAVTQPAPETLGVVAVAGKFPLHGKVLEDLATIAAARQRPFEEGHLPGAAGSERARK